MEAICIKHYVPLLTFKLKCWVMCHQPQTLEDAISLLEAYMLVKAGVHLMKNLKHRVEQGKGVRCAEGKPTKETPRGVGE